MFGKNLFFIILSLALFSDAFSQELVDTLEIKKKIHIVIKNDGTEFLGTIISQDAREVLIETQKLGQVIIPKHEIREIKEVNNEELAVSVSNIGAGTFATRYFITGNRLPIEKGESYIQWSLFGPDIQVGIGKNFGIGITTSWIGVPVFGNVNYSIQLKPKLNLGIGAFAASGSWTMPALVLAFPFASLTIGDRHRNLTVSGGYGLVSHKQNISDQSGVRKVRVNDGRYLLIIAGMTRILPKFSLVFDSFIVGPGGYYTSRSPQGIYNSRGYMEISYLVVRKRREGGFVFIPGVRWHSASDSAFQFGFAGFGMGSEISPFPVPMIQWFRKI